MKRYMAMRRFASVSFLLAGFCALDPAVTPARAQAYARGFPICLRVYGLITYTDCSYTTLPQCNAAASGRAAQCLVNRTPIHTSRTPAGTIGLAKHLQLDRAPGEPIRKDQ